VKKRRDRLRRRATVSRYRRPPDLRTRSDTVYGAGVSEIEATFVVHGNIYGFQNTRISVNKGDKVTVTASGRILFWRPPAVPPIGNGYPRDPDGRDENGVQERPASAYGPNHPAPDFIKNSLVLRIAGHLIQGGRQLTFFAPASGVIEVTNNDNDCVDNQEYWTGAIKVEATQPAPSLVARNDGQICVVHDPTGQLLLERDPTTGNHKLDLWKAMRAILRINHDVFDFVTFVTDPSLTSSRGDSTSVRSGRFTT
jgi:hypothetical protein